MHGGGGGGGGAIDPSYQAVQKRGASSSAAQRSLTMKQARNIKAKPAPVDACGVGVDLVSGLYENQLGTDGKCVRVLIKSGIFIDSVVRGRGASAARAPGGQQLQKNDQIIQAGCVVVVSLQDAADALVGERGSDVVLLVQRLYRRGKTTESARFYMTVTRS